MSDKKTVVLDAGHDAGNLANKSPDGSYYEHEFCLDMAKRIRAYLERCGVAVTETRPDGKAVSLAQRCAIANGIEGLDLFVSLHSNAAGGSGWSTARGWSCYLYGAGGAREQAASAILEQVRGAGVTVRTNALVYDPELYVLKNFSYATSENGSGIHDGFGSYVWGSVLNDVLIIQRIGTTIMSARSVRITYLTTEPVSLACLVVIFDYPLENEIYYIADQEYKDAPCCSFSESEVVEGRSIYAEAYEICRSARASCRHRVYECILLEPPHRIEYEDCLQDWLEARDRYISELCELPDAIDFRSFIKFSRNCLEACEDHRHDERETLPDTDSNHCRECEFLASEP